MAKIGWASALLLVPSPAWAVRRASSRGPNPSCHSGWLVTCASLGHEGSLRSCAGVRLLGNPRPSIVADYERTFKVLKELTADIFLAQHPNLFQMEKKVARVNAGGGNPFVDPNGYKRSSTPPRRRISHN